MEYISREEILAEYDRQHKGPAGGARKIMETWPAADVISKQAVLDALEREREYLLANGMDGAEHILVHHAINVVKDL